VAGSAGSGSPAPALAPACGSPSAAVHGVPGIVSHRVLPDKRHILAKDVGGRISRWDVLAGGVVDQYGKIDIDEKEAELFDPKVRTLKPFSSSPSSSSSSPPLY
jgi:hypothetical protein